jgi:glucuronoarabinoxylan endo-1,4-beta-xylanase
MIQKLKYSFYAVVLLYVINAPVKIFAASGTIKAKENHQTMVGFGASIAWYDDQLTSHPQKNEIYNYILNVYRNYAEGFAPYIAEIVSKMYEISPIRPKVLISSWSPPYNLKSNYGTNGGGNATLKKNSTTNQYMYGEFGKYWADALNAYKAIGIEPDYISIQNEPSFDASWESCRFDPTETTVAGYGIALDSVYYALQQADLHPKILASECHGIGYNTFQNYALHFNHSKVDGYAYHLYHGESDNVSDNHNPDLFNMNLTNVGNNYKSKPIFQTEYDRGDWFNTVWLMHNCLVNGSVSGYLWWELVWPTGGGKPLVEMDYDTYTLTKYYWAFRQYSKFISSGWNRVTATNDADSLRISAFVNPDGNKLTVVVINIGSQTKSMNFDIQDFNVDSGMVIRTSETESGDTISNSYDGKSVLDFPARSITTLSFSGALVTNVDNKPLTPIEFSLSQNYPNPFNPSTTIKFTLPQRSDIRLVLVNVLGQVLKEIATGNYSAGSHQVTLDASHLASGIYFYKLQAGSFSETKKLVLMK